MLDVEAARKDLEQYALETCMCCKDKWGDATPFCSGGAHWVRAIVDGKMQCCKCVETAYLGYMGRSYCAEHYPKEEEKEEEINNNRWWWNWYTRWSKKPMLNCLRVRVSPIGPILGVKMNKATVVQIKSIKNHPDADALDIIAFDVNGVEHELVTGKHYAEGEFGIFMPVGTTVPANLLEDMWLTGKLSGPDKNIVQGRKMRGIPSNGLFYGQIGPAWNPDWHVGQDVSKELGIV